MTTNGHHPQANALISGIAHVNLTVPSGTLDQAHAFYGETLGLKSRPVPELQKGTLAWYVKHIKQAMQSYIYPLDSFPRTN